jgi:tetratricopeptide (TPR) repeat protein
MRIRAVTVLLLLLLLLSLELLAWASPGGALEEGNRLFVRDQIEAALEAYAAGWSGNGTELDGTLAYNAGTSALRLGRLPEALLWYRRAEAATPRDAWVRDNLALTRQSLGALAEGERGAWEAWMADGRRLQAMAVVLAWAALGLLALGQRRSRGLRRSLALLALLSCMAFVAGAFLDRRGHRAAVLLAACPGGPPAGSEVWVRPAGDGGWRIAGRLPGRDGPRCPAGAVGLVTLPKGKD